MLGSECTFHIENSMVDCVTNNTTGTNIIEKQSILKLSDNLRVWVVIQYQFEIIIHSGQEIIIIGIILIIKVYEIMDIVTLIG